MKQQTRPEISKMYQLVKIVANYARDILYQDIDTDKRFTSSIVDKYNRVFLLQLF